MKRALILLFMSFALLDGFAQDTLFTEVASKSDNVIKATVLDIGRKLRFEDGMAHYTITCRVDESFKGGLKAADTIQIEITEYTFTYGGRDSISASNSESFIYRGASFVFLLNKATPRLSTAKYVYIPIDSILGVLSPNDQLLFYLRTNFKTK